MADMQAAARRYIQRVMSELELTPGALARMAGIAPSTLTRFLNDANHKFKLSSSTIEKISSASAINPFELAEGVSGQNQDGNVLSSPYIGRGTYVRGEVQPGIWIDAFDFRRPKSALRHVAIIPTGWSPTKSFAVLVRGESINMIAVDGDYLLCIEFAEFLKKHAIDEGDLVIVDRADEAMIRSELSARIVRWSRDSGNREPGIADLHLASSEKSFASDVIKRVPVDREWRSGPTRIVGVAVCVVKGTRFLNRA